MTRKNLIGLLLACILPIAAYGSTGETRRSTAAVPDNAVPSLQSIRPELRAGEVRVQIQTQGVVSFHDFALENPSRVVLDFPGTRSQIANRTIPLMPNQCVERIRIGQPQPGTTRVVLDTAAQVEYRVVQDESSITVSLGPALESRPRTTAADVAPTDPTTPEYTPKFGSVPRVEVYGGYSYARADITDLGKYSGNGGEISTTVNIGRYMGMTFDFGTQGGSASLNSIGTHILGDVGRSGVVVGLPGGLDYRNFTLLSGPRFAVRSGRLTSYVHALVGAAHIRYGNYNTAQATLTPFFNSLPLSAFELGLSGHSSTSIAVAAGGGFDLQLTRSLTLRLGQLDYLMTHYQALVVQPNNPQRVFQNNFRFTTGFVVRFGETGR
jgi:hypothetical protein